MDATDPVPQLTSDLDYWEVTLKGGEVVRLRAHAVSEEADAYVFVALVRDHLPASTSWPASRAP